VNPTLPVKTLKELVRAASAAGRLTMARAARWRVCVSRHRILSSDGCGIKATHVPYRGRRRPLTTFLDGQPVQFLTGGQQAMLPYSKMAKAAQTASRSARRNGWAEAPDIPSERRAGYPRSTSTCGTHDRDTKASPTEIVRMHEQRAPDAVLKGPDVSAAGEDGVIAMVWHVESSWATIRAEVSNSWQTSSSAPAIKLECGARATPA